MPERYREITQSTIEIVYTFDKGVGLCVHLLFLPAIAKLKCAIPFLLSTVKGRNATTCIEGKLFDGVPR